MKSPYKPVPVSSVSYVGTIYKNTKIRPLQYCKDKKQYFHDDYNHHHHFYYNFNFDPTPTII